MRMSDCAKCIAEKLCQECHGKGTRTYLCTDAITVGCDDWACGCVDGEITETCAKCAGTGKLAEIRNDTLPKMR